MGVLPIKIEALPEGSTLAPGVACFKLTNTHPRFFWLPNFLETLLVQVWYPTTVATQAREFRKTIMAYSVLSQRVSQMPAFLGPQEFTPENLKEDGLAIHIAQVFDLLDFGYRGVSSHETAQLGSAAYYATGYEGSDTVAGSRMLLRHYNAPHALKTALSAISTETLFATGNSVDERKWLRASGALFDANLPVADSERVIVRIELLCAMLCPTSAVVCCAPLSCLLAGLNSYSSTAGAKPLALAAQLAGRTPSSSSMSSQPGALVWPLATATSGSAGQSVVHDVYSSASPARLASALVCSTRVCNAPPASCGGGNVAEDVLGGVSCRGGSRYSGIHFCSS